MEVWNLQLIDFTIQGTRVARVGAQTSRSALSRISPSIFFFRHVLNKFYDFDLKILLPELQLGCENPVPGLKNHLKIVV